MFFHTELFGVVALNANLDNRSFDDFDLQMAADNVLRRNDRAAKVIAVFSVELGNRVGDCFKIALRDLLLEIGKVCACDDSLCVWR